MKIFCIGLNKTGTATIGKCGEILGMKVKGYDRNLLEDVVLRDDFERVYQLIDEYDLFQDWPWPLVYKRLDRLYPDSKFILTTRVSDSIWLKSLKSHSLITMPKEHSRKLAYGYNYPQGREKEHMDLYNAHNKEVRNYFANRPDDLLEVCWEKGDGFKQICTFLNMKYPDAELPHLNKREDVKSTVSRKLHNFILSIIDN